MAPPNQRLLWPVRRKPETLAANTILGTTIYGSRLAAQAAYFVLLARTLGVLEFGMFSGVAVLCALFGALSGLGFPVLAFRATALSPKESSGCATQGMYMIAATGLPLCAITATMATFLLPLTLPLPALILLVVSEVVLVPMLTLVSSVHQGNEQLGRSHLVLTSLWYLRLAVLATLVLAHEIDFSLLVSAHSLATLAITLFWVLLERAHLFPSVRWTSPKATDVTQGIYYAISGSAVIACTELNQAIALALVGASAVGALSISYKVIILACTPLVVACQAISPSLVRSANQHGWISRKAIGPFPYLMLAFAVLVGAMLHSLSDQIPRIFGPTYVDAADIILQLSVLPPAIAIRLLASYALMAFDQKRRVIAELICLTIGLSASFALIATRGLHGAVLAILFTEYLSATVLTLVAFSARKATRISC